MRKDDPVLTMNRIHGILFDMDGVLFDSERALRSCWQELGDRLGLGDMTGVYQECLGVNTVSSGAILRRAYGEDFDWEGFRRESSALYLRRFGDGSLPVKPGAREILDFFRDRGLPLALASSTNGDLVRHFLGKAGLLSYFSVLVTGDMVSRSKPDPEIFLRACALLGIEPRQALVVEPGRLGRGDARGNGAGSDGAGRGDGAQGKLDLSGSCRSAAGLRPAVSKQKPLVCAKKA